MVMHLMLHSLDVLETKYNLLIQNMSMTTVVSGVAGLAAVATALSIISVVYLINDINSFYDDAIGELEEFKVHSTR